MIAYDNTTGIFKRKTEDRWVEITQRDSEGYLVAKWNGKLIRLHWLAFLLTRGEEGVNMPHGHVIIHVDGDKLNNKLSNLNWVDPMHWRNAHLNLGRRSQLGLLEDYSKYTV